MARQPIQPILLLLFAGLAGCATTSEYRFPDAHGQQCFAPCESQRSSCHTHCALLADDPLLQVACHLECSMAVEQCASSCGGWRGSREGGRPSTQQLDERQRELKAMMDRMEGSAGSRGSSEAHCVVLYDAVSSAASPDCPPRERFLETCNQLMPEVARCLNPSVLKKEREACKEAMRREDPQRASAMNDILSRCYDSAR